MSCRSFKYISCSMCLNTLTKWSIYEIIKFCLSMGVLNEFLYSWKLVKIRVYYYLSLLITYS